MDRATENKIVLITRKTRLEDLILRFNTEQQAQFYVEHLGADFSDYKTEHEVYHRELHTARDVLQRLGRLQVVDRSFVPNFLFGETDTVVVLGQDGLVANVLKYLNGQHVIGVNPDPKRWEGVLLPFKAIELRHVVADVFRQARPVKEITMARAELNDGQVLFGVNDLFIGPRSHTSARYRIEVSGHAENHSSSGIIVSTGLGSTGWLRSILTGAAGIAGALSGSSKSVREKKPVPWDADYIYFSVREPWPSKTSSAEITFGKITPGTPLKLLSYMPENGVIFSDGIETDYLEFNSGTTALVTVADKKGHLVV